MIYLVDLTQNKVVSRHRLVTSAVDAERRYCRQIARLGGGAYARTRIIRWDRNETEVLNRLLENPDFKGGEGLD
jgi:hypothetical protein